MFGGSALDALVCAASREGLWGLENLSAIPDASARLRQNVGAYGQSLDEVVEALEVFDLRTGQCAWWVAKDCDFSYRNSRFRRSLGAYLVLTPACGCIATAILCWATPGLRGAFGEDPFPGAQARPSDLAQAVCAPCAQKSCRLASSPERRKLKTPSYLKRLFSMAERSGPGACLATLLILWR